MPKGRVWEPRAGPLAKSGKVVEKVQKSAKRRRKKKMTESRIQNAIARIKEQDRKVEAEKERREHARKADEIAAKRVELEDKVEGYALQLRDGLEQLRELDAEHRKALHRAGRAVPHSLNDSMVSLVGGWMRDRLHLHGLTDRAVSPPFTNDRKQRERALSERDLLARMVTDGQGG